MKNYFNNLHTSLYKSVYLMDFNKKMKEKNELSYRDLKMICNQDMFKFDTTQELEPINDGIGQERGIKALEFGIDVNVKGYN